MADNTSAFDELSESRAMGVYNRDLDTVRSSAAAYPERARPEGSETAHAPPTPPGIMYSQDGMLNNSTHTMARNSEQLPLLIIFIGRMWLA